ncbi:MAG TPA: CHAD domain-containing protein [Rhodopila sp.]
MELELAANAETVTALSRLKALSACRDGRPRSQAIKIVWYDSPERGLLADGLTLAEQRGVRRLERLVPGVDTWLPAQPAPVVAEAPDETDLPSPLAPLAAFEGRQTISVHTFADQTVVLTVAKGVLRAVTAEHPIARIWLSGEEQAVRAAVLLIGEAGPVAVPLASMAAEAIAVATGSPVPPRHLGAPTLPPGPLSVSDALMHIVGHLIDVILAHAPNAVLPGGEGPEAVHQMRVAVRRARSALSIFRTVLPDGALDAANAGLKELGARLGPVRDWDVFADETAPVIQQALPNDERLERLITAASRRRRECQKALAAWLGSSAFRMLGIELAWFAAARFWHVIPEAAAEETTGQPASPPSLAEFSAQVLQHRWKRLVSSGKGIEGLDIPSLHNVRLRAKRARYAAEMFATLHRGKASERFIRRLSVLQQHLGVLNDGAVATHLLAELGGPAGRHAYATGIVVGFLAARASRIRPRIERAFERFRRQPTYWA